MTREPRGVEAVPPVRPERPAPSAKRTWPVAALLTAGVSLLLSALAGALFLWTDGAVNYRYWPADSRIDGGGAQIVEVEAGEEFLLWKDLVDDTPECAVRESLSGEVVALEDVDGRWERGAGAVPYVAFARGTSSSARVQVSCDRPALSSVRLDHPNGPPPVDPVGPWWPLPIVGAGLGLALLAGGIVVACRRPRRIS